LKQGHLQADFGLAKKHNRRSGMGVRPNYFTCAAQLGPASPFQKKNAFEVAARSGTANAAR